MITSDIQKPNIGSLVTLFQIDATDIGASEVWYLTQTISGTNTISFDAHEYTPIDILAEGFDMSNTGKAPRPTLSISNVNNTISSEIAEYQDLLGAKVTRIRTLAKYLDGSPYADTTATFPVDKYIINQKKGQNSKVIQFELVSALDLEKLMIPGRQILRDTCTYTYRYYSGGAFVYSNATCPYTAATYYEKNGDSTTDPALDVCGKRLSDCNLRYPLASDELPYGGFPSVSRGRI